MTKLSNMYWEEDQKDADYKRKHPFVCRICSPNSTYPQNEKRFNLFYQWYDHIKSQHPLNVIPDYEF